MDDSVQLKVVEAIQDDINTGTVRLDSSFMKLLDVGPGDFVTVSGERPTVALVDRSLPGDIGLNIIRMDGLIRRNAKTSIGDFVTVKKAEVIEASEVTIAPAREGLKIKVDNPLFFNRALYRRALVKGDLISLGGNFSRFGLGDLKFVVVDVKPKKEAVIVTDRTTVECLSESAELKEDGEVPEVSYEDIGGLGEELKKVREMIELPLRHPELFETLGIEPPKGVLLHGPPGTGKTLLAKAVANETNSNFYVINGPEIMSKFYGQSEENLRKIFEEAEKNAPSIIFIDEIDAIAPKREESKGEVERRVVAQLLTIMDGLNTRGKVVVMAATNIPNSIDPALRRPGRFDRELEINPPDIEGRLNILKIHTRNMPLQGNYYDDIAKELLLEAIDKKLNDTQRFDHLSHNKIEKVEYLSSLGQSNQLYDILGLIKEIEGSVEIWASKDPAKEFESITKGKVDAVIAQTVRDLIDIELVNKSFYTKVRRSGAIDRELKSLAEITHGFVGADLASLAKEAAMIVLRRLLPDLKLADDEEVPREILASVKITQNDLLDALKVVRPSAMREVLVETPTTTWQDVGGMQDVKQELQEAVEWPLKNKEVFRRMGVRPPRGVLLYGPPGTGKTLLAKAVAKESESNFISIKGPELLSKWVGESERAVREIFNKARQVSPAIIFIDEIDAMAASRSAQSDTKVNEKVVNQLLTEMDGLQELNDVVVIAATNRPDVMDTALLRPGRFDRIILAGVPDVQGREAVFKVHTANMPLASSVDIKKLVDLTEGYVGADIEAVCREAAMFELRDSGFEAKEVTWKSFEKALAKVRPSASKEIQAAYAELQDKFSSARGKELQEEKPAYYG